MNARVEMFLLRNINVKVMVTMRHKKMTVTVRHKMMMT